MDGFTTLATAHLPSGTRLNMHHTLSIPGRQSVRGTRSTTPSGIGSWQRRARPSRQSSTCAAIQPSFHRYAEGEGGREGEAWRLGSMRSLAWRGGTWSAFWWWVPHDMPKKITESMNHKRSTCLAVAPVPILVPRRPLRNHSSLIRPNGSRPGLFGRPRKSSPRPRTSCWPWASSGVWGGILHWAPIYDPG